MSIEENKNIVLRYQAIYNSNDLDALSEVVAEDLAMPKVMSGMPSGLEGAKKVHKTTLIGMPDWHTAIEDLIAEGDKVVARITLTGTHTGDFWGISPASILSTFELGKSWNTGVRRMVLVCYNNSKHFQQIE
jgi:predicted ester cyclase